MSSIPKIVPGSTSFGRKYQLQIFLDQGLQTEILTVTDSDFEPEALRIVFDVYTPCFATYWWADINIYNLNMTTTKSLISAASAIKQGMIVVLKAGYKNGNFDVIWQGPVFQALWSRENVVDFKLSLHCIFSLESALSGAVISPANSAAGASQSEILNGMIASLGLHADSISPTISQKKLSRGKKMFGSPERYFNWLAEDNNMIWFLSHRGITFGSLTDRQTSTEPAIKYTPTTGLLDTPQQTQNGVNFTVLLDPRLRAQIPLMTVAIDQAAIQQYKLSINELILPLDKDGVYVLGEVRHRGDSRGVPWYTEVTGYEKVGSAMAWAFNANINR